MTLLSIFISIIIGFLTISLLEKEESILSNIYFKMSLSVGTGFGISSLLFFIWLNISGSSKGYNIAEIIILSILSILVLFKYRYFPIKKEDPKTSHDQKPHPILLAGFITVFTLGLLYYFVNSLSNEHGGWDAIFIWNHRARMLFDSLPGFWTDAFTRYSAHTDYPLLLPALVAKNWVFSGYNNQSNPILVGLFFAISILGMLVSSLSSLKGKNTALFAGVILFGFPVFILHSSNQMADIPLSFYFLSTVILLYTGFRIDKNDKSLNLSEKSLFSYIKSNYSPIFLLAGFVAGLGSWTKNEGLLFLLISILICLIPALFLRNKKFAINQSFWFFIGLLPVMLVIIYFKLHFAEPNDIISAQGVSTTAKLMDLSRYWIILKAFFVYGVNVMGGVVGFVLLSLYVLFSGVEVKKTDKQNIIMLAALICAMIAGYFVIYVITPAKLEWQLGTSAGRLFLQLLPTAIFTFSLMIKSIDNH